MKKNKVIIVISTLLLVSALIGSLFLDDILGNKISNIVSIVTAIIGAIALFVQFKKDKDLNMAAFVVDYSIHFYQIYKLNDILDELEKCRKNPDYKIDIDKYYKDIVSYLQWLESLASIVKDNLLTIEKIDDVLSYRFFLIVNNKQIQDAELIPCKEFYRGIFKLYEKWAQYKKKKGLLIIFEENALNQRPEYKEIVTKNK